MAKSHLRLVAPNTVNCTVGPRRPKNAELRTREHLTPDEVERLIEAAKANRQNLLAGLISDLAQRPSQKQSTKACAAVRSSTRYGQNRHYLHRFDWEDREMRVIFGKL